MADLDPLRQSMQMQIIGVILMISVTCHRPEDVVGGRRSGEPCFRARGPTAFPGVQGPAVFAMRLSLASPPAHR